VKETMPKRGYVQQHVARELLPNKQRLGSEDHQHKTCLLVLLKSKKKTLGLKMNTSAARELIAELFEKCHEYQQHVKAFPREDDSVVRQEVKELLQQFNSLIYQPDQEETPVVFIQK